MRNVSLRKRAATVGTATLLFVLMASLLTPQKPTQALPVYARRYQVTCDACHTTVPSLNATGLAFQANHFNWPGGPPVKTSGLAAIPISALATYSSFRDLTARVTNSEFQTVQIFLTDGFRVGQGSGGYFIDDYAYVNGGQNNSLGNAFLSIPLAGPQGQLAVTAGQFTPIAYQYDPINSLTQSLPATLANSVDGFSFADPHPGIRLEYFDNRGAGTANGDYVMLGVPFQGQLALNNQSDIQGPQGIYAQAFRRTGGTTAGAFGFQNGGHYIAGGMATYRWHRDLYLMATGQFSHDRFGHAQIASAQADYIVSSQLALTGRLETMNGEESATFPVFGVTYYPFRPQVIRLAAETTQERANRSVSFFIIGQF